MVEFDKTNIIYYYIKQEKKKREKRLELTWRKTMMSYTLPRQVAQSTSF